MSLEATYDRNNIFAKIIRGEMPAIRVFENESTVAIMDIFPESDGHVLAIPKLSQATNFLDISADDLKNYIVDVQTVAQATTKALAPDGVRIVQFNGAPAGQTVFHLHFHIIPIYAGKTLARHAGEQADMAKLEAIAAKIRAAF